jgi:dienelactone hydrolase
MKIIARILFGLLAILVIATAGFIVWGSTPAGPMPEALAALQSTSRVGVTTEPWLVFAPASGASQTGLILYPGGRVDYRAYAPLGRDLAEAGYRVIIPSMPLNLAVFSPDSASEIIQAFPEVKYWAVGGHSLGGAMAANFLKRNPGQAAGLVLLAAYPAEGDDLSTSDLKVVSIYATQDGLATPSQIMASKPLLPAETGWVQIEGGNHAQFGWYGEQAGDFPALITRQAQQDQVVAALVEFLKALE